LNSKVKFVCTAVLLAFLLVASIPWTGVSEAKHAHPHILRLELLGGQAVILLAPRGVKILEIDDSISELLRERAQNVLLQTMTYRPLALPDRLEASPTTVSGPTIHEVLKWIGAENINATGRGIVVGIVDTGADFSSKSLGEDRIAVDDSGRPMLLDADEFGLALTPLNVTLRDRFTRMLATGGREVIVYVPTVGFARVYVDYDWKAPSIDSKSGYYKFGFLVAFMLPYNSMLGGAAPGVGFLVPVVLVDSEVPGVYDTAFADLSTTWFTIGSFFYGLGALPYPPSQELADFSFSDERSLRMGSGIAALDFNNDGVYDFSLGVISGCVYDAFGIINRSGVDLTLAWERGWEPRASGIYPGLDPEGRYVDFFYDPIGHGTTVASIIAGKHASYTLPSVSGTATIKSRGIAPNARIAAAMALLSGNVIAALYWLSGHDYVNGTWVYTGAHKADVISNSWGVVYWPSLLLMDGGGFIPGGDPIAHHIEKISSKSIVVFAGGNQGPGLSSIAIGGATHNVLTVGASTIFGKPIYDALGHLIVPEGVGGSVASWSSRGPGLLGTLKPDLVAPGAFALLPTSTLNGFGDGNRAIDVFGGTSMSAPIVSASIALLLEKAREEGVDLDARAIKSLVARGTVDLKLPPEVQGLGLLNVSRLLGALEESEHEKCALDDVPTALRVVGNSIAVPSKLLEDGDLALEISVLDSHFYEEEVTLKRFEPEFVTIPLESSSPNSPVLIKVEALGELNRTSLPLVIVWAGVWADKNGDGIRQINEMLLLDHGILNGRRTSLIVGPVAFEKLRERSLQDRSGSNVNITVMLFSLGMQEEIKALVTAGLIASLDVPLVKEEYSTALGLAVSNTSIIPYGYTTAYLKTESCRFPVVLERPLLLDGSPVRVAISERSMRGSHTAELLSLGDSYTIPIRLIPEMHAGGVLGYIVRIREGFVDLYVASSIAASSGSGAGLSRIVLAHAGHPPGYVSSLRGFYPNPKYGETKLFIPYGLLASSELRLVIYVVDASRSIELEFEPVLVSVRALPSKVIVNIHSSIPLGRISIPEEMTAYEHAGGPLSIAVHGVAGAPVLVLDGFWYKRLDTYISQNEVHTTTSIGSERTVRVRAPSLAVACEPASKLKRQPVFD